MRVLLPSTTWLALFCLAAAAGTVPCADTVAGAAASRAADRAMDRRECLVRVFMVWVLP